MNHSIKTMAVGAITTALLALPGAAWAKTIFIEQWGANQSNCGSKVSPCESIQYASYWRAGPRDRLVVGPGDYVGDLNIDGNHLGQKLVGLSLESVVGRHGTRIIGVVNSQVIRVVAEKVRIGRRGKGFTVTQDHSDAVTLIRAQHAGNLRIESNALVNGAYGFQGSGGGFLIRDNIVRSVTGIDCSRCWRSRVLSNRVEDPVYYGIVLGDNNPYADRTVVAGNLVTGQSNSNFHAIRVGSAATNYQLINNVVVDARGTGIEILGTNGAKIMGNIVVGAGFQGMEITERNNPTPSLVANNHVEGSGGDGIRLFNVSRMKLNGNSAIHNGAFGISVSFGYTPVQISGGNLFGNESGCGIENSSSQEIHYNRVFFGNAGGPDTDYSADDHDTVCGTPEVTGTHATKAQPIKVNKARLL